MLAASVGAGECLDGESIGAFGFPLHSQGDAAGAACRGPTILSQAQADDQVATARVTAEARMAEARRLPGSNILVQATDPIIPGGHLTWGEATKQMVRWPTEADLVKNAVRLARVFETVRAKNGGVPLKIISGYRPPHINRLVGGKRRSQHLYFKALDVWPHDGNYGSLLEAVKATSAVHGIGRRKKRDFIHMDIRSEPRVLFNY